MRSSSLRPRPSLGATHRFTAYREAIRYRQKIVGYFTRLRRAVNSAFDGDDRISDHTSFGRSFVLSLYQQTGLTCGFRLYLQLIRRDFYGLCSKHTGRWRSGGVQLGQFGLMSFGRRNAAIMTIEDEVRPQDRLRRPGQLMLWKI
jgi:hypothetical protein